MNKRKLRRVAIVALVLVLLCNTLGVQASTKKDDPTVIVKDYGSLYTAIAEAKGSDRATTEAPESTSIADKNINIEAKGVDVKLEITGDSYNISISAPEGQESQIQPVNEVSTVNAPESTTEAQRSPNWVEYITMLLLAVLVGLEIKDKLHKEK